MPDPTPIDRGRRRGGRYEFEADLPALAVFGRRFDDLYDRYYARTPPADGGAARDSAEGQAARTDPGDRPPPEAAAPVFGLGAPGGISPEVEERIKALRQSPEVRRVLAQQDAALERLRGLHPDAARKMEKELALLRSFAADPAAAVAGMAAAGGSDDGGRKGAPLPPGRFRFDCGDDGPTDTQRALFAWLETHQAEVAATVEGALRELHAEWAEGVDTDDPRNRVLFPQDAENSDLPLDCIRVDTIYLAGSGDRVGFEFETVLDDEHGCAMVLEGGEVVDQGYLDVLELLEGDGENDDDEGETDDGDDEQE